MCCDYIGIKSPPMITFPRIFRFFQILISHLIWLSLSCSLGSFRQAEPFHACGCSSRQLFFAKIRNFITLCTTMVCHRCKCQTQLIWMSLYCVTCTVYICFCFDPCTYNCFNPCRHAWVVSILRMLHYTRFKITNELSLNWRLPLNTKSLILL